jgi:primosomal protein N' (replication factor Y)
VVDEAHDDSYKQSQNPKYDARRVAAKLGLINHATVIYGTATPNIADYQTFLDHKIPIIRMDKPINESIKPAKTQLIDSKDRSIFNKSTIFSNPMLKAIDDSLKTKNQILVFLNRRGTARVVICESCGWLATCPDCDTNQIYHADSHQLVCHICGRKSYAPSSCPSCQKTTLSFKSHGTKSIENELLKLFSNAKIMRFDSDNPKSDSLGEQYQELLNNNVGIIIGTQIIAKGLHLPKLNLVCIPFADTGITLPDFSSEERSYQLLRQVVGRVGRTNSHSKVIIQSFSSENSVIKTVINNDWVNFFNDQLFQRKKYHLPPYYYLLQLTIRRKTDDNARKNAMALKENLPSKFNNIEILGPSPRFHNKTAGNYNWQLIIKSKSRGQLVAISKDIPSGWQSNIDPVNLL